MLFRLLFSNLQRQAEHAPEVQGRIASEMIDRAYVEPRPPEDDIDREPVPERRPHPRAQWDEAAGEWIQWDEAELEWEPVEEGRPAGETERREAPPPPLGST